MQEDLKAARFDFVSRDKLKLQLTQRRIIPNGLLELVNSFSCSRHASWHCRQLIPGSMTWGERVRQDRSPLKLAIG
jgi:hypothetical protein